MPEIYRGPAQKNKGNILHGEGSEQDVYIRKDGKVVKEKSPNLSKIMNTPEFIRAEVYLTKIAHILFPESIPDIHASHLTDKRGGAQTVHEYRDTSSDEYHEDVRKYHVDPNHPIPKYELIQEELAKRREEVRPFQEELEKAGITLNDTSLQNYIIGGDATQFVDRLYPARLDPETGKLTVIDTNLLKQTIDEKIQDPETKRRALTHLKRLEQLLAILIQNENTK